MAEIAAGLLGPVIEVVKWVGPPIKRQFNYLCCFASNITSLKNDAEKLQRNAEDLQSRADEETNNGRVILKGVDNLLKSSKNTKEEIDGILKEAPNVESGCLKLWARYSLSKRAKKKSDHLKDLQGEYNKFDTAAIACEGPPAAMKPVLTETTYEFKSRKQIEEDIMTTLKSGDENMIGIYGMGGLGKTTMAEKIMNRALKENIFKEVVKVVVSQTVDELRIQVEIGGQLGLKKLQEETPQTRAHKLHERLSGDSDTDRILLVLDDVWGELDLVSLGIPRNQRKCTILLTSRNLDGLAKMDVKKVVQLKILSEEDAKSLFEHTYGECLDDTGFSSKAIQIINKCKGLPLALKTVGSALKGMMAGKALTDKTKLSLWNNALRQMKKCDPKIPGFLADVYNPLKLSYNVLDRQHQFVFLLCCLYPEDAHISLESLTYFSMGLGIFEEGITKVEEAREDMCSLAIMLKSRSLLLDSKRGDDYVRMHDVVRDFCIFIAKEEKYIGGNDCSWISSYQKPEISLVLLLPNLRLISWICDSVNEEFKVVDSSFLEGIRDLYVLHIERDSLTSLPFTTQLMKNLKTLVIDSCDRLETLSSIGELVSLEILVCHSCGSIKELPREMEGLTRLKVLDLTCCRNLKRIGRGIISNLVGLEELKMLGSFEKWEAEDREVRENAGLKELEALTKLRCLEIEIENPALAAENMKLSSKLNRFELFVKKLPSQRRGYFFNFFRGMYFREFGFYSHQFSKKLRLHLEGESCLGGWIEMQLLRHTEFLWLEGDGANNVDLAKSENIRELELGDCASMKKMVRASSNGGVLPYMERLRLFNLPELEKIWDGPIWLNLKELRLENLRSLNQFWKSSGVDLEKDYLPQLETLRISRCMKMVQVFTWDENENGSHQILHITKRFPKLKDVRLYDLPNLTSFFNGIQSIEFPQLSTLSVEKCRKLNWMVSEGNDNNSGVGGDESSSNAHIHQRQEEVSLRCLKVLRTDWNPCGGHKMHISIYNGLEKLDIFEYQGSMSLFSTSITGALVNLTKLTIEHCGEMVKVISDEEEVVSGGERTPLFPKLQELELNDLPKLVSFCKWKCDVELPSLTRVNISRCPNMKNFSLGPLTTPNLESFDTDLDNDIQVPFNSTKELMINGNDKPLNSYNIHESLFNRLEALIISRYKGNMSLFSTSITGALVNLTKLTIENSNEMVKVIEDEEDVICGGESTPPFPKLQELKLIELPKLVSFCEWKCDVELPSLRRVEITYCCSMKNFSFGSLITPKLTIVKINYKDFYATKDLNDALRQQWCLREEQH